MEEEGKKEDDQKAEDNNDAKVVDEQGILLFDLDNLTKNRSKYGIINTKAQDVAVDSFISDYNSTINDGSLANVCLLDTLNPSTFMNVLKRDPITSDILMRISTFELSNLVPMIRIFKIFFNPITKEEIPVELPFDTNAAGIETIFESSLGRGEGAGITSVEWKQVPKNEAALPIYNLSLNLYLQNVDEFFKVRNYVTTTNNQVLDVKIEDLLYQRRDFRQATNEGTAIYNQDYFTIKMIVGWKVSDSGLEQIRQNASTQDVELLIKAISEQKDVMYLGFQKHDIQFQEDGSINLQITYNGRSETLMMDIEKSNVLNAGKSFEEEMDRLKKQIEGFQNDINELSNIKQNMDANIALETDPAKMSPLSYEIQQAGDDSDDVQERIDDIKKVIDENKKEIEQKKKSAKRAKFGFLMQRLAEHYYIHKYRYDKTLIDRLTSLRGGPELTNPTEIKNIEEQKKRLDIVKTSLFAPSPEANENINASAVDASAVKKAREQKGLLQSVMDFFSSEPIQEPKDEMEAALKEQQQQDEQEQQDQNLVTVVEQGDFGKEKLPEGKFELSFFYLSSLIDLMMEPILNTNFQNPNFLNKKLRVILGPMTIVDYGSLVDTGRVYRVFNKVEDKEGTYVKIYTGEQKVINVGDIPISVKSFTSWFNEEITNKNIEQMNLSEFLTSLINGLIFKSLTTEVYTYAPKQKARLAIDSFSAITSVRNENLFCKNIVNYKKTSGVGSSALRPKAAGFRMNSSVLGSLRTHPKDIEKDMNKLDNSYVPNRDYVVIYCINNSPYERLGDYEDDLRNGILHFYAGNSTGTVRSMKFSRVDNPRAATANILANTVEGRANSKMIREKYNVAIEMFGNTSVQAGTFIFVSPTFPGASNIAKTEKRLRDLGLGGYYLVTEVHNTIELGEFKTTLRAQWCAFADGTMNDGDKETAPFDPKVHSSLKGVLQ